MELCIEADRSEKVICELLFVWEGSVRETHHFLSDDDIDGIKRYVPEALATVETLVIARDNSGCALGFMGVEGCHLEMLFVAREHRGEGIGSRLLQFGLDRLCVCDLAVNEQNPQARAFYEHMGFHVYDRSDVDEQGQPYPILYMRTE